MKFHKAINKCKCICGDQLNTQEHEDWYQSSSITGGVKSFFSGTQMNASGLVTKHINGEDKMVWLDNAVWHWDPDTDAPASWNMDHADAQAYENLNNV